MLSKTFEEYAWRDLVESGDLKKLLVSELNKYLKHYKLVSNGTKAEKIRRISLHVLRGNHGQQEDTNEFTDEETKECGTEDDSEEIDSSGDDESEEDIVLGEFLSGPDSDQDTIATSSRERERYSIDESENGMVCLSKRFRWGGILWFWLSLQTVDFLKKLIRVAITEPNMKHYSINPFHFFMPCGH